MEENVKIEEEIEWEDAEATTRSDLISCAYYAISAVDEIDLTLISKIEANKIKVQITADNPPKIIASLNP